ncbi:hypothetical protein IGI04_026377 [Brassica rapa subsp. trilocularis]|uniref:Uncharacterized protein n=1 Tax=Brassica rapa subsp. trilocularis TaxID=1813537 RepID=A0ABQ7KYH9_BRACM|nr:hypothetical protein IGI04_026377 [Brassica rapa subsp. trilocularis]
MVQEVIRGADSQCGLEVVAKVQEEIRGADSQRGLAVVAKVQEEIRGVDLQSRLGVTSPQAEGKLSVNVEEETVNRVQMVDKGDDSIKEESKTKEATAGNQEVNVWSLVFPAKTGRLFFSTQKDNEIQISVSKFSDLSVEEEEEGEIVAEFRNGLEVVVSEVNEEIEIFEGELLEDENLEQQKKIRVSPKSTFRNRFFLTKKLGEERIETSDESSKQVVTQRQNVRPARSLRSDRAIVRARSLRSDRSLRRDRPSRSVRYVATELGRSSSLLATESSSRSSVATVATRLSRSLRSDRAIVPLGSLRSDRARAEARSLRSDRAIVPLDRATESSQARYVATELSATERSSRSVPTYIATSDRPRSVAT